MVEGQKVVCLRGSRVPFDREPVAEVITELEELLEKAKAGEIIGLVAATLYYDRLSGWTSAGHSMRALIGALEVAKTSLVNDDLSNQE